MSLDGIILRHLKYELENTIKGSKIYQPSRYELSIVLRNNNENYTLIMSASPDSPRVTITSADIKNPEKPPDFCMLMRKKLLASRIVSIEQKYLERALYFKIQSKDEMGFIKLYTLAVEIMGKYSNIILIDEQGKIVNAIKKVNSKMSSKRVVLPGIEYRKPPPQNKICLLNTEKNDIMKSILNFNENKSVTSSIIETLQGVSNIICIWIVKSIGCDLPLKIGELTVSDRENLIKCISKLNDIVKNVSGKPFLVHLDNGFMDISCLAIDGYKCDDYESFSQLIEHYYYKKIINERINSRVGDLIKLVQNLINSRKKKIINQERELEEYKQNESYKIIGDILISNIYKIKRGMISIDLVNFFSESEESVNIKLDSNMDGSQNAQRYYKLYKKAKVAEQILKEQIKNSKSDIIYLEGVIDALQRSNSESETRSIYDEVCGQGYIKISKKSKSKLKNKTKVINLMEFKSPNGFKISIGKNGSQNDKLTYKIARKNDIWFHVKDLPGSHTILFTDWKEPSDEDILFAAELCAIHSSARNSNNVNVDYTKIMNVKKPDNYKPGMAIYYKYKTINVRLDNLNIKQ